jgi:hypothetical protein
MDASSSLLEVPRTSELLDGRRAQGLRHPLASILALTTIAPLSGIRTQAGVFDFARARGGTFLRLLDFRKFHPPSCAMLSRVFRAIDVIALDGKVLHGSCDGDLPAVHLLSAFAPEIQTALAQLRVDATTNEHKAALELLGVLLLREGS